MLYESFDGNGMLDSPLSIFRHLRQDPEFAHLTHVWVIADPTVYAQSMGEYARPTRELRVYKSKEYYDRLSTAKYLINNTSFPREFAKRPGQVYVNTWHGIPLKRMGYDFPTARTVPETSCGTWSRRTTSCPRTAYMTDVMYKQAFKLDGIYQGTVVQAGYPRIDGQFLNEPGQAGCARNCATRASRWTSARSSCTPRPGEATPSRPPTSTSRPRAARRGGHAQIDTNRHQVLVKVHQFVYRHATFDWRLQGLLVPNDVPVNSLLGVTDVLVTDYSSLFYDFLAQDKPVVFYAPDLDDYQEGRGSTPLRARGPAPSCAPGRTSPRPPRWLPARHPPSSPDGHGGRPSTRVRSGNSTRRVVDVIFRGLRGDVAIHDGLVSPEKTRVLLYAGGLFRNGITGSLLALLNHIDYSRYDVSIFYNYSSDEVRLGYARQVHPAVRHFPGSER